MQTRRTKAPFSHAFLLAHLRYNPRTGKWYRLDRFKGETCYIDPRGYQYIKLKGERYSAHILAWFYMTRRWPKKIVDHKDNNRSNIRWNNLRLANARQNSANRKCPKHNLLGVKGVTLDHGRIRARIRVQGKLKHLGYFSTIADAHNAYFAAAKKAFKQFSRAA